MGAGGRNASCYSVGPNEPYRSSRTCRRLEGGLLFVVYDLHYTTPLFSLERTCHAVETNLPPRRKLGGNHCSFYRNLCIWRCQHRHQRRARSRHCLHRAALLLAKCGAKIVRHFVDIFDGLTDLIRAAVRTLRTWRHRMDTACPEPDEAPSLNMSPRHDKTDPTERPKPKPSSVRSMRKRPHPHRKNRKRPRSSKKQTR